MSTQGQVGHRHDIGDEGIGWTGVTDQEKRDAGGRAGPDMPPAARLFRAVRNANRVAARHGSGHWTGERK